MPLTVDDAEVDRLVECLVAIRKLSTTEIVRQALQHELERAEAGERLVAEGLAFMRALQARGDAAKSEPVDRPFIDSLYETK